MIDRDTAARLGITPQNIDDTLDDAFGQRQVSTIFTQQNQYHVVLEVAPKFQRNPASLDNIYVKSSNGTQVPLSTFTHFEEKQTPLAINHQGQFPAGDDLVQPGAGQVDRRCGGCGEQGEGRAEYAAERECGVPGFGERRLRLRWRMSRC